MTDLNSEKLKRIHFFKSINWQSLLERKTPPPFVPALPRGELDCSNFDETYTKINCPSSTWSTGPTLTNSQEDQFKGFSFSRSFTPPPASSSTAVASNSGVVDVSGIQHELSAELLSLSRGHQPGNETDVVDAYDE